VGNPRMNCVADDLHRRRLADRGRPGRTHGNAVTNPRIRVCSTVVLTALSPALRNRFIPPCPYLRRDCTRALNVIDNEHPSSCATTGSNRVFQSYDDLVDHCCEAWNKLRAGRSPLANHVHRIMPMGARVLITGTWYKWPCQFQ
jgi:hypothetical protein